MLALTHFTFRETSCDSPKIQNAPSISFSKQLATKVGCWLLTKRKKPFEITKESDDLLNDTGSTVAQW